MSIASTMLNPFEALWDRLFNEAENRMVNSHDWYSREGVYRAHDRLHVLFGHLDPQTVNEKVLLKGLLDAGMDGQAAITLWTAWKALTAPSVNPAVAARR